MTFRRSASHRTIGTALVAMLAAVLAAGCGGDGGSDGDGLGEPAPAPGITAGQVTFLNSCAVSLTLQSSGPALGTLAASGGTVSVAVSAFNQGAQNVIMPYPNTSASQCPAATATAGPRSAARPARRSAKASCGTARTTPTPRTAIPT